MSDTSLKEKTAKGLFWGGFSNGIQQLLNLGFGIVLARLLDASDYGMVGMFTIFSAIAAAFNAGKAIPTTGIKLAKGEDGKLSVEITIQAYYGYRLTEVAENVRLAIADAIKGQTGADVASVDVYVDGLSFEE